MITYELIYVAFCLILAVINAILIKQGHLINHWINGLLHISFWVTGYFIIGWWALVLPFVGRLFFDMMLSVFRGLSPFYVTNTTDTKHESQVDKIEKSVFGMNGWLPKLIYLIIILITAFIWIQHHS